MLIFVYWGFIILFVGTLIVAPDYDLGLDILRGQFYLYYSFILDVAGGLALISLTFYILRRYIFSRYAVVSSWAGRLILSCPACYSKVNEAMQGYDKQIRITDIMELVGSLV